MMTNKISTGLNETSRHVPFQPKHLEKDAAAWANLLDDWLGPENDIYARLLQRSEPEAPDATKADGQ